jgi:excisionase family DNA binding protein
MRTQLGDSTNEDLGVHGIEVIGQRWLRVPEAAAYASLSRDTIYTACERGELRHVRVGGRRAIRLRTDWVDSWLKRHVRGVEDANTAATMVR